MAKDRRPHGTGGLYHPTYKAPDGTLRRLSTWWIAYRAGGKLIREATKTAVKAEAERMLRKRLEAAGAGRLGPDAHRTTLATLEKILADDYVVNGRDELRVKARFKPLVSYFGEKALARSITTDRLRAFQKHHITEGAAPATINRHLAALRRAFRLASIAGKVDAVPHFPMLREDNVRQGFVERGQFEALRRHSPDWLTPALAFMYLTGWRRSETLTLEWRQIDRAAGVARLEPGTTKNKAGRTLPYHAIPELRDVIDAQWRATSTLQRERGVIIAHVFHRDGEPLVDAKGRPKPMLYDAWRAAAKAAGLPGRLLHDFRRSAVRNMERAGVSRSVAMQITGHKTEAVYRRYAIVSEADIAEGLAKVAALPKAQEKR